jgi:hypothetical protein
VPDEESEALLDLMEPEMAEALKDLPSMGDATLYGVVDAAIVAATVEDLMEQILPGSVDTEEFQGASIHSLDLGGIALLWSSASKLFVVSQYPTAVRATLRTVGTAEVPSVLDNERFRKAFEANRDAGLFSVTDTRAALRSMLAAGSVFLTVAQEAMEVVEGALELPPLPDPAVIDRHIEGQLVSALRRTASGLRWSFSSQ